MHTKNHQQQLLELKKQDNIFKVNLQVSIAILHFSNKELEFNFKKTCL